MIVCLKLLEDSRLGGLFFFLRLMSVTASRPLILFAALCFFVLFWSLIKRRSRDELDNGALPPAQMMKSARSHPANEIKSRTCSAVVEREMWRVNQNTGYLTTCLRVLVIIIVEYTTLTRQHPLLRLFIVFSTLAQGLCTCL